MNGTSTGLCLIFLFDIRSIEFSGTGQLANKSLSQTVRSLFYQYTVLSMVRNMVQKD
jgi:hypothetical protein